MHFLGIIAKTLKLKFVCAEDKKLWMRMFFRNDNFFAKIMFLLQVTSQLDYFGHVIWEPKYRLL